MDASLSSESSNAEDSLESIQAREPQQAREEPLYERISEGFVALDRNLHYIYVNHQAELISGLDKADLLGKYIWDLYPEARKSIFGQKYYEALTTNKPTRFEAFYPVSRRWYELRIYPAPDGLSIFYEDLTLRKQIEKQLHFQASISKSISDAVIATDVHNYILSWNNAAEVLYGWKEAEVLGRRGAEILPTRFLYNPPHEWEERLLTRGYWQGECIQKRKDGSEIHVQAYISLVKDEAGNVIGRVAANRDITERKLFEQSKDIFLTIASHELRTPLTTIKVLTQMLKKTADRRSLPDFVRSLTRMEQQINLLAKLVSVLIDGAKIQLENPLYYEEAISIDELIGTTVAAFQKTTATHTITTSGTVSARVQGDRERLKQALIELLKNAVQYSPQASKVDIILSEHDHFVTIGVQDYGDGISKQDQVGIFDRFHRKYSSKRKTPPGLGLGLYIANEIVKRHRGTISIKSEEGKGALFTISLPTL